MAPKIIVPADFGIENLHSQRHGNVAVKLQGNTEMRANSLILSYNSPVFVNMFMNLEISSLEMEDFSADAVKLFLEALYTGEIQLNKRLFRDTNKMASVFKVSWLMARCEKYFTDVVHGIDDTDYDEMVYVFEEAWYVKIAIKNSDYLGTFVEKISNSMNKEMFIERYMYSSYSTFSTDMLDIMAEIAGKHVSILMKMIKNKISQSMAFDDISRYLLQRINLALCIDNDMKLYEDLFDLLLEKVENISNEDMKMIVKLNMDATKEYRMILKGINDNINEPKAAPLTHDTACSSSQSRSELSLVNDNTIPNLFHANEYNLVFLNSSLDQLLDFLSSSEVIKSLYMFLEAVNGWLYHDKQDIISHIGTPEMERVMHLIKERGWSKVHPNFFNAVTYCYKDIMGGPMNLHYFNLVSATDTTRIVGNEIFTAENMLLNESTYMFYFQHPKARHCPNPTQCGFMLKVTPVTKENPESFNIQVITNTETYPGNIHYHPDVMTINNMHLVIEWVHSDTMEDNDPTKWGWVTDIISLEKRPRYEGGLEDNLYWGNLDIKNQDCFRNRFAIYYLDPK